MLDASKTPLQRFVSRVLAQLPQARDWYDKKYQERTNTSGKPLYDIERGKSLNPGIRTLRVVSEIVGQPVTLFQRAIDGEEVEPEAMTIAARAASEEPQQPPTRSASEGETVPVIVLDLSLPMGPGAEIGDYVEESTISMDVSLLRSLTRSPFHRLRILKGIGDSMEPTLRSGDLVVIDTTYNRLDFEDKIWACRIRGLGAVKRLRSASKGQVRIISDNPAVENDIADEGEIAILGRVVGAIRVM